MKTKEDIKLEEMGIRGLRCDKCNEWHPCHPDYKSITNVKIIAIDNTHF